VWQPSDEGLLADVTARPEPIWPTFPIRLDLPQIGPRAQQAAEDALAVPARADGRIGARGATSITC
jgi:hypothetical protein